MSSTAHILETAATLLRYREEEFLCDTAIITSDRQIKAHSVLLAAVSPVFRGAFASSISSSGMYQVDLQSVESHVLETALDFVYTGQLIVPSREFASQERLSTLFSTLQDLGLDVNKLNGCEIKFKSELKRKNAKVLKEGSLIAEPISKAQTGSIMQQIKTEVDNAIDLDIPLQVDEYTVDDESLEEDSEVKHSLTENNLSTVDCDGEVNCSDDVVGQTAGDDNDEEEMDQGEQCLLIENNEQEDGKFYFMLVPNSGASNVKEPDGKPKVRQASSYDGTAAKHNVVLHSGKNTQLSGGLKTQHLCDVCGMKFKVMSALEEHILSKHADHTMTSSLFHCSSCGELLEGEDKIEEHLENSPECCSSENTAIQVTMLQSGDARRPFLCDTCGKNFSSALSLRMHTKLHTGERPFSCSHCSKSFVQKVQMIQHEQRHLGIRPYSCDLCERTFSQKGQLTLHTRLHTGERPFLCEFCDSSFVSRPLLTQHRRMHTGERPHVCATCAKNFAHKESLIVHMRTHTGEKPFECPVCGNKYTQSHHLKGHMRTHTGEKPFACHLCDKTYKNRVDLRFHCTRVHGIDISKRKNKPLFIIADVSEAEAVL